MTVTLDSFLASKPEFARTSPVLISTILAEALLQIDYNVWGPKADQGLIYLTAHLLTLSPMGQNARMIVQGKDGQQPTTTYWGHYKMLQRQVGSGFRVAGGPPLTGWGCGGFGGP
jgi:hypothetical protein